MVEKRRRSPAFRFYRWVRRFLGPSTRELLRVGKVAQILWDSATLQKKQRRYYQSAGARAIELVRAGKVQDIHLERILAKVDRSERILKRQDVLLRGYQQRGDIKEVLRDKANTNKDHLEPV